MTHVEFGLGERAGRNEYPIGLIGLHNTSELDGRRMPRAQAVLRLPECRGAFGPGEMIITASVPVTATAGCPPRSISIPTRLTGPVTETWSNRWRSCVMEQIVS